MRLSPNAIITAFLVLVLSSFTPVQKVAAQTFDDDVQIVSSDENGIILNYVAPTAQLITLDGYPENYKYPLMARTASNRIPGQPILPIKIIPIGVPFGADPSITILSQSYSPLEHMDVAQFFGNVSPEQLLASAAILQSWEQWPEQNAYIMGEEIIRGLRIIKVGLAAAKLENGSVLKAEDIAVKIDFNGPYSPRSSSPRPLGPVFGKILPQLVANYEVASNWRINWPPVSKESQAMASPFDSSTAWVRMEIINAGIYKIGRYDLVNAGIDVGTIDPRQFRVFYGGGAEVPFDNSRPRPVLREIPIYVSGSDDGSFDYNDQLLFYGETTDRFEYSQSDGRFVFRHNHYTAKNVYWLTYGGNFIGEPKRWPDIDGSPAGTPFMAMTSSEDYVHNEQDLIFYREGSSGEYSNYFEWYWGKQATFNVNVQLFDLVSGVEGRLVVRTRNPFTSLMVNNIEAVRDSVYHPANYYLYFFTTTNLRTGFNSLSLENSSEFFLDYVEIHYERLLKLSDNVLTFTSPTNPGLIEYHLTGATQDAFLLDISSPDSVKRIINGSLSGDELVFQGSNTGRHRFYIAAPARFRSVSKLSKYEPDNLREETNNADYLIITHPTFLDHANELAAHRERVNPEITTRVVSVDDIYNQFSWGLYDPLAIRDFLKYSYEHWSGAQSAYALLIGNGHYDYRNNLGGGKPNYMPPFEAVNPPEGGSSASDENYIYFGRYGYLDSDSSGSSDMIIGRLPVNSAGDMDIIVDKIINYEESPVMGKWRNQLIICADDNLGGEEIYASYHTIEAETLAERHVPKTFEVKKIYLLEYPFRAGNLKVDAREALISAFNAGALIVNWTGHGSRSLWAHEQLFRRAEDIPRLRNGRKLPMVLAASCSIAFFDDPNEQGLAEDFITRAGGGSIASIGATRLVSAVDNTALNNEIYDQLLYNDSISFGEAFYMAKFIRQVENPYGPSANDRNYMLFGDPGTICAKPGLKTQFTYTPDTLRGLAVDSVAGGVYDGAGNFVSDFNGTIQVLVKDASIRRHKVLTGYNNQPLPSIVYVDYVLPGPTIFNGPAQVTNGRFSTSFFVPKDVTYGGTGARIYVYFDNGVVDGSGMVDSLSIAGGVAEGVDTVGPTIEVSYNERSLNDGVVGLPPGATIKARLYDPNGINMTGTMGHGIEVSIDNGDAYQADVTDKFAFDLGSWQRGEVSFELPELSVGEHTFSLKAWDTYNNSTLFSGAIKIYENQGFVLSEVMNYPNPAVKTDSTVFQYLLNRPAEHVSLNIYTLAGRKVKSFNLTGSQYSSDGYNFVPYNLRDDDGDRLASGVYIYKIEASGVGFDGKRSKDSFQSKLVILR